MGNNCCAKRPEYNMKGMQDIRDDKSDDYGRYKINPVSNQKDMLEEL
jgi:hypothetical protein